VIETEPRLLLRPRLRSWLQSTVLQRAKTHLSDNSLDVSARLHALTVLRTSFEDDYHEAVLVLSQSGAIDAKLLDRLAFHLLSIESTTRARPEYQDAIIRLLTAVRDQVRSLNQNEQDTLEMFRSSTYLLEEARWTAPRTRGAMLDDSLIERLTSLIGKLREDPVWHSLASDLLSISLLRDISMDASELRRFEEKWSKWPELVRTVIQPAIASLSALMLDDDSYIRVESKPRALTTTPFEVLAADELSFLASATRVGGAFGSCLSGVGFWLNAPAGSRNQVSITAITNVADFAQQLSDNVFSKESALRRFALGLTSTRCSDAVRALAAELALSCPGSTVEISPGPTLLDDLSSPYLLIPSRVWYEVLSALVANVAAYAAAEDNQLRIVVRCRLADGGVAIDVADSAPRRPPKADRSVVTKRLNNSLSLYGGYLNTQAIGAVFTSTGNVSCQLKQELLLPLASPRLRALCAL
jgi:hypothetical protein